MSADVIDLDTERKRRADRDAAEAAQLEQLKIKQGLIAVADLVLAGFVIYFLTRG